MKRVVIVILIGLFVGVNIAYTQIKGEPKEPYNPDTVFVFKSPRPLIDKDFSQDPTSKAWGFDLIFSSNGFGAGVFYQIGLFKDFSAFASLYISGARKTDEFEYWDPWTRTYRVPNKINRLYMFPLTFGFQYNILTEKLSETLKPYLNLGLGPTFILSTPYDREFFEAFGYASFYTRFGAFVGLGATFGSNPNSLMGTSFRYYFIPFGGDGLESVKNEPIKDFGGVFLSFSIGIRF